MTEDEFFMERALSLARRGAGHVNPNPMVGAVIVRDGSIIGEGWHQQYGGPHAERNALAACAGQAKGATLYVTLEPCCHTGKTPPCTQAILEQKIGRVVVGSKDPNPRVNGGGMRVLREAGILVTQGVLEEKCQRLNASFFHYIKTKTPFVTLKYAMTMDGKIATRVGHSRWVTGNPARVRVHEDRGRHTAIMTGVGTVLADDPMLNCRLPGSRQPVRLICDTHLRTPLTARVVATAREQPTWLLTCCETGIEGYEAAGCRVICVPKCHGRVDLRQAMKILGACGIDSVYLEGGETLNASALEAGIVQAVHCYIAPKLFGGARARTPLGGRGVEFPDEALMLQIGEMTRYGEDILIEGTVKEEMECSQEL